MTVKLLSALPKDDKNGLASIESTLADRYYPAGAPPRSSCSNRSA